MKEKEGQARGQEEEGGPMACGMPGLGTAFQPPLLWGSACIGMEVLEEFLACAHAPCLPEAVPAAEPFLCAVDKSVQRSL